MVKVKIQIITEGKKNGHARYNTVIAEKFFLFSLFSRLSLSLFLFPFPSRYQTSINIEPSARWLSSLISRRGIDLVRPHGGRTGILRPLETQVQTVSNAGKRFLSRFSNYPL